MVQFAGSYQLVETVNAAEILKAAGEEVTDQKLAALNNTNSTFSVEADGDNYVFTTSIGGDAWKKETKFTIGKAYQEGLTGKATAETIASKEGDKIVFTSVSGGKTTKRHYAFTDSGVEMVLNTAAGVAKRIYKRV